jgi:cobalamin biosynthesis protein CobD/CbiB
VDDDLGGSLRRHQARKHLVVGFFELVITLIVAASAFLLWVISDSLPFKISAALLLAGVAAILMVAVADVAHGIALLRRGATDVEGADERLERYVQRARPSLRVLRRVLRLFRRTPEWGDS